MWRTIKGLRLRDCNVHLVCEVGGIVLGRAIVDFLSLIVATDSRRSCVACLTGLLERTFLVHAVNIQDML